MRLHLVLFSTLGRPHDSGLDLQAESTKIIRAASSLYDSVLSFTPESLIAQNPDWADTLQDRSAEVQSDVRFNSMRKWNRNWSEMGFQVWKPRLILEVLNDPSISPGDVILYHDVNYTKYPDYRVGILRAPLWLKRGMVRKDVILFRDDKTKITADVKREVLEAYLPESDWPRLKHVWAGALAVKKTPSGIKFASDWYDLCRIDENVSPLTKFPQATGFVQHSPEQAMLSVLWHSKYRNNTKVVISDLANSRRIRPPDRWPARRVV